MSINVDHDLAMELAKLHRWDGALASNLLAEHRNVDGRCAVCGPVGGSRVIWPCTLHSLATAAEQLGPLVQRGLA